MIRALILLALLVPKLAFAVCTATDAYSTTICTDSPLGYWRLNETSGSTFTDSSGNGNNGTKVGSPTLNSSGPFSGTASVYSGSVSNYITYTNAAAFSFGTGDFVFEAWAQPDATGGPYRVIYSKGYSPGFDLEMSAGTFSGYCNGQFTPSFSPSANTWYHVVTHRISGTISVEVNAASKSVTSSSCNVNINNSDPVRTHYVNGGFADAHLYVSEFAIYTSLSTTRVSAHYNCGWSGTSCDSGGVPIRRIFKSSWERKRPDVPSLLARGVPPLVIDEPFFIAARLNALAEIPRGQYDGAAP